MNLARLLFGIFLLITSYFIGESLIFKKFSVLNPYFDNLLFAFAIVFPVFFFTKEEEEIKESNTFILTFLFMFSLIFRFFFRSKGLLHMDSIVYVNTASAIVDSGRLHYAHSPGFPGVGIIYGLSNLFLDLPIEKVSIYASVFIGSLSIPLTYLFVYRFTRNQGIALITALLLMVNPLHWSLSEQALSDILSFFFLILTAYMLTFDNGMKILSGIAFGIAISIRLTNILFFPFYIFLLFKEREIGSLLKGSILSFTGLLFYFPVYLLYGFEYFTSSAARNKFVPTLLPKIKDYLFDIFSVSLSTAFIPLFLFGMTILLKKRRYFHLSALILWIVPFFFYYGNVLTVAARYFIPIIPPLLILISFGLKSIRKNARMLLIFLILLQSIGYIYPVLDSRSTHSYQEEFALYVKNNTETNSLLVVSEETAFIQYFGNRTAIPLNVTLTKSCLMEGKNVYVVSSAFFKRGGEEKEVEFRGTFNFTLVGTRLNEDFHHRAIYSGFFNESLYKLRLKNESKGGEI